MVERARRDYRAAGLDARTLALCRFAERLTLWPTLVDETSIAELRELGWSDAAIDDAIQVVGYFNYLNRVTDVRSPE